MAFLGARTIDSCTDTSQKNFRKSGPLLVSPAIKFLVGTSSCELDKDKVKIVFKPLHSELKISLVFGTRRNLLE